MIYFRFCSISTWLIKYKQMSVTDHVTLYRHRCDFIRSSFPLKLKMLFATSQIMLENMIKFLKFMFNFSLQLFYFKLQKNLK